MMRWRLLLEEHHRKAVHNVGVDNDAVDALSRLDLTENAYNHITWGIKNKHLEHIDIQMMNICIFVLLLIVMY